MRKPNNNMPLLLIDRSELENIWHKSSMDLILCLNWNVLDLWGGGTKQKDGDGYLILIWSAFVFFNSFLGRFASAHYWTAKHPWKHTNCYHSLWPWLSTFCDKNDNWVQSHLCTKSFIMHKYVANLYTFFHKLGQLLVVYTQTTNIIISQHCWKPTCCIDRT